MKSFGIWGQALLAEDLPHVLPWEPGGVGDAPLRVGPLPPGPVGVYGARPGVDRARGEALEAEAADAAQRRLASSSGRPVYQCTRERVQGAGSSACSSIGGEGAVLLI